MKTPPDKYRTLKISLKQLQHDNIDYLPLIDAILRTHKLTILVYQFMRSYILHQYTNNKEMSLIDESVILMAYKTLMKTAIAGPKPKGKNLEILNKFTEFYNNEFKNLINQNKIDGCNLSQIIAYSCTDILTNIENNIKLNFFKYLKKFVNESFKEANNNILQNLKGKECIEKRKELNKELYELKEDLINNTQLCNVKYYDWLNTNRSKILPLQFTKSYEHDIELNPQKYIKYMIKMNKLLEDKKLKCFQFFPLRTDIVPKFIQIDTKSLVEIFVKKEKNKYLDKLSDYKDELWNTYFKTNHKIFKQKAYTFDKCISTDGFSVSIRFINNKYVESENNKKEKIKQGRAKAKELYKDLDQNEIQKIKDNAKIKKKEIDSENKLKLKQKKGEFKKLTKEEKKKVVDSYKEFKYLDELDNNKLEEIKTRTKVYCDPGLRSIFYMIDDKNKIFNYTNKLRVKETKRLKYQRLIKNYKTKNNIIQEETKLTSFNSKTCNYIKFKEYIKEKTEVNSKLFAKYENMYFRKLKWFSYLNTKRSEDNLLDKIEKTYGKNPVIVMGDCCENIQKLKFISTPNIALKRKIKDKFEVYLIDEFRTSCLNYKTEERQENLYLPDKTNELRKIHSILTYQTENNRKGCINRDKNAVYNMKKLTDHFLQTGERLEKYRREVKIEKIVKDSNRNKKLSNRVKPVKVQLC
jgi:hypothetical protein